MTSIADMNVARPRAGTAVVECVGEHDLSTREETGELFRALLVDHDLVVVDVTDAKFIDSSFVNNLYIANGYAHQFGKRFRLQAGTSPIVRRVLEISGVFERLDHASTREEALAGPAG
jgi:anti-anti-sigma factor